MTVHRDRAIASAYQHALRCVHAMRTAQMTEQFDDEPVDLAAWSASPPSTLAEPERVDFATPPPWWTAREPWGAELERVARSALPPSECARELVGLPFGLASPSVRDAVTRARRHAK